MPIIKYSPMVMELVGDDKLQYDKLQRIADQIETLKQEIITHALVVEGGQVSLI